jgi:hypothetical protein
MFLGELRSRSVKPPSAERVSLTMDSIEKILDAMNRDEDLMNAMGGVEPGRATSRPIMVPVRLQAASGANAGRKSVIAYVSKRRVGELNPDDDMALEQVLQVPRQQNQSLTMHGVYHRRDAADPARFVLYPGAIHYR